MSHTNENLSIVRAIHSIGRKCVLAYTGGGSLFGSLLMTTPGASNTISEIVVPYSEQSLTRFLKCTPEQACASKTARQMAMKAFELAAVDGNFLGVGITCSLATNMPKRGSHRFHIAIQSANNTQVVSITLDKDTRTRYQEEEIVELEALRCLAVFHHISLPDYLFEREYLSLNERKLLVSFSAQINAGDDAYKLFGYGMNCENLVAIPIIPAVANLNSIDTPKVVFPGSFNPRHNGHIAIKDFAQKLTGHKICHEISLGNVDKANIDYIDIKNRIDAFTADETVLLTNAVTFVDKSHLFPGCTFVIGWDTFVRLADSRCYKRVFGQHVDDEALLNSAIAELQKNKAKFLVFPRNNNSTKIENIPESLMKLCEFISINDFCLDISSTAIRSGSL